MEIPSRLVEQAVEQFASLPGIGKRTALRLVMHLLNEPKETSLQFAHSISNMRKQIRFCAQCHNICEDELCGICVNPKRDAQTICVVENIRDLIAIENTQQYSGVYHILGGNISPMDGIGPQDLNISSLIARAEKNEAKEIILALSTTMEGDTTNFYLFRKLEAFCTNISTIARGVAIGDEIEYTDEVTLGKSILNRTQYNSSLSN